MRNYVIRWTRDQYGHRAGEYATQGMTYGPRGSSPDLQSAYVFNNRMARRGALHNATTKALADYGAEVIWINLVVAQ